MLKNITDVINLFTFLDVGKLIYSIKVTQWKMQNSYIELFFVGKMNPRKIFCQDLMLYCRMPKRLCVQLKQLLVWFQSHNSAKK